MNPFEIAIYGIAFLIAVIIYYLVGQWTHEVGHRNHQMEIQAKLLSLIAEKNGVDKKAIEGILGSIPQSNPIRINIYIILLLLVVALGIMLHALT